MAANTAAFAVIDGVDGCRRWRGWLSTRAWMSAVQTVRAAPWSASALAEMG
jgi:hypothetical protein